MENGTRNKSVAAPVGSGKQYSVAISQYHAGQTFTPCVAVRDLGRGRVSVDLSWFDASDRSSSNHASCRGTVQAAEDWLRLKGVHLDAQGIY